jgi:DNA-binding protein HU-beta
MNQAEFTERLASRMGSKGEAVKAIKAVMAELKDAIHAGEKVQIAGFGVFHQKIREPRIGRNPASGETIQIPKKARPGFYPSSTFVASTQAAHDAAAAQPPA